MTTVHVNGIDMFYEDLTDNSSSRPPVLLITGLGGVGGAWGPLAPLLAKERRVIIPDHRGCGRSTHTLEGLTLPQLAADMSALVRELGCGPVHVVGSSTGGAIGQRMAIEHPDTVATLTPIASWGDSDEYFTTWFRIRKHVLQKLDYSDHVDLTQLLLYSPDYRATGDPALVLQRNRMMSASADPTAIEEARIDMILAHHALGELSSITTPALVLSGGADVICPPYLGQQLANAIPDSEFEVLPGAGHYSHQEKPELVNAKVAAFIDRHDLTS